ncbi:flavodoxin family protein [bacterium]|nr:flavodoxin family protein [bacterium]
MSKKVLIISTSLRNNANSEILAHETERGAKDAGHDVEFVTLKDKTINFCKGCLACQKIGHCVINDDANAITEKMKEADVIVWATPVYYYEMAGQMKTMIDRANSLFATGHQFKEIYLIATAADGSQGVAQTVINGLNGWIACFSGVKLCGYVEGAGLEGANEAKDNKNLMEEAYNMGKNI